MLPHGQMLKGGLHKLGELTQPERKSKTQLKAQIILYAAIEVTDKQLDVQIWTEFNML